MEEIESKAIFGRRLKRFREGKRLHAVDPCEYLGVERSTYTYYETGKTTPAIFDLMRLCRLYRISLDELCGYSANSVDAMRLSDSGQRVKVYARRKERRYLADSVLDLSTDEQQLLAYYRSASPEDRAELFEHLRNARYRDRRHANEK